MREAKKIIKKSSLLFAIFLMICCNNSTNNKELPTTKKTEKVSKNLIYFDLELVSDIDINNESELELYKINNPKIEYLDDIIYIKTSINANACDHFTCNLDYEDDKINVKLNQISEETCVSNSKFEVRLIINNKKLKKYKIDFNFNDSIE